MNDDSGIKLIYKKNSIDMRHVWKQKLWL